MTIPHFSSFAEATQDLLEVVNIALPNKTLFLAKKLKDSFTIEKVLDNQTGVVISEGIVLPNEYSY